MLIGLAQGLVPTDPDDLTPERARAIAALGVDRIVTHFAVPPREMTGRRGADARRVLEDAGLGVVQCAGLGPNLVSPDAAVRRHWVEAVAELVASAATLGATMALTGCGSHHPTFSYGPSPKNHTPGARSRLVESLRALARHAEAAGVPVALECHVLTTLDTPAHAREVLDAVDSPWIRANFDPVNFLGSVADVYGSGAVARDAAATLGPRLAPAAHVKDVLIEPDLVARIVEAAPGSGWMDIDAVIDACAAHLPADASLIVEHLGPEESAVALQYAAARARARGLLDR